MNQQLSMRRWEHRRASELGITPTESTLKKHAAPSCVFPIPGDMSLQSTLGVAALVLRATGQKTQASEKQIVKEHSYLLFNNLLL